MLTGNVMVDHRAMTGPGGVVLASDRHAERFRAWAAVAASRGAQVCMQLSYPGRQMPAALKQDTIAPSEVPMDLGNFSKQFAPPRAMSEADIADVLARFIRAAVLAEQFGFSGVQIHAAHGYLLSQFLSPITNKRTDRWAGAIENRARLLVEVVKGVRAAVDKGFAVSVKLNSADFQSRRLQRGRRQAGRRDAQSAGRGPYRAVRRQLRGPGHARPGPRWPHPDTRSLLPGVRQGPRRGGRHAHHGDRRHPPAAGGRTGAGQRIDMVGMGTALAIDPALPKAWRQGTDSAPVLRPITWRNKVLASVGYMAMVKHQLHRLSLGRRANPDVAVPTLGAPPGLSPLPHRRKRRKLCDGNSPKRCSYALAKMPWFT